MCAGGGHHAWLPVGCGASNSSCSHVKCLRETLERGINIGSRFQKFQQLGRFAPLLLVCGEAGHVGVKAWSKDRKLNRKQRQNTLHRHTPATHFPQGLPL